MFPRSKKSKGAHSNDDIPMSTIDNGANDKQKKFEVFFLGIVQDIVMSNSLTRDREAELVDRIEESQIEGSLPVAGQEDGRVMINVSIHGIKVIDIKGQEILQRHPLHTIAQVVQYSDGGHTNNIVFKIGNVNKPVFSAYVFQCMNEEQAGMICQKVRAMFDKIKDRNR